MREYELVYILDPSLDEDSTKALVGQIEESITRQGVAIETTEPWGRRRLAYAIGKHGDGYYVWSRLQAEAGAVHELERRLRVTDGVLRFITVRVDKEQAKTERRRARKEERDRARQARRSTRGGGEERPAAGRQGAGRPVSSDGPDDEEVETAAHDAASGEEES